MDAVPTITPPSREETAESLLEALRHLQAEGRIAIALDPKRLMHIDSPVAFEAESNQWVYGLLVLTVLIWWQLGWEIGLGVAAASVLVYLTLAKSLVRRKIERRVREQVLTDIVRWRKLWSFGGVGLRASETAGTECEAPGGNWMAFVRSFERR